LLKIRRTIVTGQANDLTCPQVSYNYSVATCDPATPQSPPQVRPVKSYFEPLYDFEGEVVCQVMQPGSEILAGTTTGTSTSSSR
jgi:hypothetical protein